MYSKHDSIYGFPIVPRKDENDMPYGLFEGIVIDRLSIAHHIEIAKMVKTEKGYYTSSFITISFDEELEHNETSGKKLADFLISKAKEIAKENEPIAFGDELALYLRVKDSSWKEVQELLAELAKQPINT